MDETNSNILAWVALVLSVGSVVIGVVNHRRVRSNCCGKTASVSLDIDNTSPLASRT